MIEETHSLKCQYKGVQPFVKVTAYELSAVDCSADRMSGYYGETATLTANAAPAGYNFSGWNITGSNMTGNSFRFQGDVTAKAGYSAIPVVYNLTLQTDGHGTLTANKVTGYVGDTVTLSPNSNDYYHFNNYSVTGGSINGNTFTFGEGNATARANFATNAFTATGNFSVATNSEYATATSASAYPIIRGITGTLPTAYGTVNNRFLPSNISAFTCSAQHKSDCTGSTTASYKDATTYLRIGDNVLDSAYAYGGGSNWWQVEYLNRLMQYKMANGGHWYLLTQVKNSSKTYLAITANSGVWRATGIAK